MAKRTEDTTLWVSKELKEHLKTLKVGRMTFEDVLRQQFGLELRGFLPRQTKYAFGEIEVGFTKGFVLEIGEYELLWQAMRQYQKRHNVKLKIHDRTPISAKVTRVK